MKLIIAGGRNNSLGMGDTQRLDYIIEHDGVTEIVSGCARGIDTSAIYFARNSGIPLKKFRADWKRYGNGAGNIRNEQMALYADAVALFIGGKGTQDMYERAVKHGLKIYDFRNSDFKG